MREGTPVKLFERKMTTNYTIGKKFRPLKYNYIPLTPTRMHILQIPLWNVGGRPF